MGLNPGTRIGRFEVSSLLGAGGMGEVYHAYDLTLRREVALKLLSPRFAQSRTHLLRFEREARAASALNHPHICTIYDIGSDEAAGGRPYLVMELLRGSTLHELLAAGPLPTAVVLSLGIQIADGLDAAHAAGIVHRDIKPANIFVTARGDAKLLDFGVAMFGGGPEPPIEVGATDAAARLVTTMGAALGTVLYMSPEQALGQSIDHRTDIFSFGLVLYEMLVGRRAFDGGSTAAVVEAILQDVPAGLSDEATSTVPRVLRRILRRALEKDKNQRLSSVAELGAALRAMQSGSIAGREFAAADPSDRRPSSDGLTVTSGVFRDAGPFAPVTSVSGPELAPSPPPRRRAWSSLAAGGAMVVFVLAGGYAAVATYRARHPPVGSREPLLLADFANTTGETVFDGALKDALEIELGQSPYLNVVSRPQVRSALRLAGRSPEAPVTAAVARDLCQRLGVKAILAGAIAPLGQAYVISLDAQACQSGETFAREQVQAAARDAVLPSVGAAAARLRRRLGESIRSIERFNVPVQNATTASLQALKAYSTGADLRARVGDVQAIPLFEHALELDPNFALAAARLGAIYLNVQETELAQRYMKRAFALSDALSEPERLFIKANYHYTVTGRLDETIGTYRLWISLYPHDWVPHNNLSAALYSLNRFDEALTEAREAVRLAPDSIVPSEQEARTLLAMDRFAECRDLLRAAIRRGIDSSFMRVLLFDLAFLDGNQAAMQEQLRAVSSRTDDYLVVAEAARAALSTGDLSMGKTLYAQATTKALAAQMHDYAGSLVAEQAVYGALIGDRAAARADAARARELSTGPGTAWMAALAEAFAGRSASAMQLTARYLRMTPAAPHVVSAFGPILKAATAVADGDPRQAIALLEGAAPYDRTTGIWQPYLRGLAYLALRAPGDAAAQFRAALAHRGSEPTAPWRSLARLHLARALRDGGDRQAARLEYQQFQSAWSNADPRLPLYVAARREAGEIR